MCVCASEFVRGFARMCVDAWLCEWRVLQWAAGYLLCCVCLLLQSFCYHNTEPQQLLCWLLPYLGPMGAPIAYSAPRGQYTEAPTEAQATGTRHNRLSS